MFDEAKSERVSGTVARCAGRGRASTFPFGERRDPTSTRFGGALSWMFAALTAGALAAPPLSARSPDVLLYNHSPSMPVGFYLRTKGEIALGSIVTVSASDVAHDYAAERAFDHPGDRFIKHVAALSGARVCAIGDIITIDGREVAQRRERDGAERTLPTWSGCVVLNADQVLLLGETPDSFDGRYWGLISKRMIEGVWRPFFITQH